MLRVGKEAGNRQVRTAKEQNKDIWFRKGPAENSAQLYSWKGTPQAYLTPFLSPDAFDFDADLHARFAVCSLTSAKRESETSLLVLRKAPLKGWYNVPTFLKSHLECVGNDREEHDLVDAHIPCLSHLIQEAMPPANPEASRHGANGSSGLACFKGD
jgi:hypothetical protein